MGEPAVRAPVPAQADFPLPAGFEDLAHLAEFALPTERERHAKRLATPIETLDEVYNTLLPRVVDAISYLDQFPLADLDAAQTNLLRLTFVFVEVSTAVELLRSPDVPEGFDHRRFKVHF